MIFLSHTHSDKPLVEEIALHLAGVFGQDSVFYDSWSIHPGDGIIDRINQGLDNCRFFFFFVSQASLQSRMVELEWQNALMKATKGEAKLIPVRIGDVIMPPILLQTLFIDTFNQGIEVTTRQMIEVIRGTNIFNPANAAEFQNVQAYVQYGITKTIVEFRAEHYMEPHSRFVILLNNTQDQISWVLQGELLAETGFNPNISVGGETVNAILVCRSRPTSPGFPFIVEITSTGGAPIWFRGAMRLVDQNTFKSIPAHITSCA